VHASDSTSYVTNDPERIKVLGRAKKSHLKGRLPGTLEPGSGTGLAILKQVRELAPKLIQPLQFSLVFYSFVVLPTRSARLLEWIIQHRRDFFAIRPNKIG
jgi:hypothetical protein